MQKAYPPSPIFLLSLIALWQQYPKGKWATGKLDADYYLSPKRAGCTRNIFVTPSGLVPLDSTVLLKGVNSAMLTDGGVRNNFETGSCLDN